MSPTDLFNDAKTGEPRSDASVCSFWQNCKDNHRVEVVKQNPESNIDVAVYNINFLVSYS